MFEGFRVVAIDTGETVIRARVGGDGPPLLLLHGDPQTHAMWNKVAPRLAQDFTVVAADPRGYGGSCKPPTTADHQPYSKRAMARDQVEVMRQLGFDRFYQTGHDRGGRCAYRLTLDHPERVLKLAGLDILSTYEHLVRTDMAFALGYRHWFFLAQSYDLPERLLGADPDCYYWRRRWPERPAFFTPEALEDFRASWNNPATIHAMCEDYRAGARIDLADHGRRHMGCPVLALWSARGSWPQWYDVLAVWRDWADDVRGRGVACGHYLAEEAPHETYEELRRFFLED